MKSGFRVIYLVFLSIVFVAAAIALFGCSPKPSASMHESPTSEPPQLLRLIGLWADRAEGKDVPAIREIAVSDSDESDGKVSFSVNIHFWNPKHYAEPHVLLRGIADQDTGRIINMSVYGSTYGPAFTEEKIAYLQPYAETMIGALDPSLTDAECGEILDELNFSVERLAALEQSLRISTGNAMPTTERNGIRYSLGWWGSEEGGTVEVIATLPSPE